MPPVDTLLRTRRTIRTGPFHVTVSLPLDVADRVRGNPVYRRLLGPVLTGRRQARTRSWPVPTGTEPAGTAPITAEARALWQQVAAIDWCHTIDLGQGVVTPGRVDHRDDVPLYGLPQSLAGRRVLDVATADGFWAFELERRGAEVLALDGADDHAARRRDRMPGAADGSSAAGFVLAQRALGSRVHRIEGSVYDLDPQRIGMFDLVFMDDVLRGLRCPQRALESAAGVCRGEIVVADTFTPMLESVGDFAIAEYGAPGGSWWLPNVKTLATMMTVAGCEPVEELARFPVPGRPEPPMPGRSMPASPMQKVVLRGRVADEPRWLQELRAWAEKTPPKWRSAAEQL